jgi:hypothetical protein
VSQPKRASLKKQDANFLSHHFVCFHSSLKVANPQTKGQAPFIYRNSVREAAQGLTTKGEEGCQQDGNQISQQSGDFRLCSFKTFQ